MKTLNYLVLVIVLLFVISLTSCSEDDVAPEESTDNGTTNIDFNLVGTWKATKTEQMFL